MFESSASPRSKLRRTNQAIVSNARVCSVADFCDPAARTFGDAVTKVLRPPSRPEQRGQYRATNMIVATMNAATSDSARSNAFDRDFAVASGGTMTLRRRPHFANEPANISGLHWI
jgi:hypothetical protein